MTGEKIENQIIKKTHRLSNEELFDDPEDKEFLEKVEKITNDPEKAKEIMRLVYVWLEQKKTIEEIDNKEYF